MKKVAFISLLLLLFSQTYWEKCHHKMSDLKKSVISQLTPTDQLFSFHHNLWQVSSTYIYIFPCCYIISLWFFYKEEGLSFCSSLEQILHLLNTFSLHLDCELLEGRDPNLHMCLKYLLLITWKALIDISSMFFCFLNLSFHN